MEFRLSVPADAKEVMGLQQSLFPDDPIALIKHDFAPEAFPTVKIVVACELSQVVGFAVLRNRPYRPWTGGDFVGIAESSQGKGVGKRLVKFALAQASRPLVRIFVEPNNTIARNLYRSLGFFPFGIRKQNYPDGGDAQIMMCWCL